jgi:putative photosynthetic complex assembly protein 2
LLGYLLPVLYVLFLWWFTTGVVLYLDGLPQRTYRWTMLGASVLGLVSLAVLAWTRDDPTTLGAYLAFTAALLVWGWHETSFLMGYVTGPSRAPLVAGATGWARFWQALRTMLWHELAIAVTALAIVLLLWDAANPIGMWTFLILWVMRISAKLNVFLGVPNLAEQFLPDHLAHLKSYLRRQPMNLLFPISVTASTVVLAVMAYEAAAVEPGTFTAVAYCLGAGLLALALLEHWFLVLPLADSALWGWAMRSRQQVAIADDAAPNGRTVTLPVSVVPVVGGV